MPAPAADAGSEDAAECDPTHACDAAPPDECLNEDYQVTYSVGECIDGRCSYPSTITPCTCGPCSMGCVAFPTHGLFPCGGFPDPPITTSDASFDAPGRM
jgi:hypothetical protein